MRGQTSIDVEVTIGTDKCGRVSVGAGRHNMINQLKLLTPVCLHVITAACLLRTESNAGPLVSQYSVYFLYFSPYALYF